MGPQSKGGAKVIERRMRSILGRDSPLLARLIESNTRKCVRLDEKTLAADWSYFDSEEQAGRVEDRQQAKRPSGFRAGEGNQDYTAGAVEALVKAMGL